MRPLRIFFCLALLSSAVPADDLRGVRADLRIDVPLVLIPVQVTTPLGASVPNLGRGSFHIFEDNIEQRIASFANDDTPVSIGLLFDMSGSMRDKMRKACESAAELLKTANPEDEFFLIEFNSRPKLVLPFTRDVDDIQHELVRAHPFGQTSLLDAIHLGLLQMKEARYSRKALVVLSDGGDNHSRFSEAEIKEAIVETDVQLYAMGVFGSDGVVTSTREERDGPRLLGDLAGETGGRYFPIENIQDLPAAAARIGQELRYQYLLGYVPSNAERDGKYRRIKVVVTAPELRARYRPGYRAPLN